MPTEITDTLIVILSRNREEKVHTHKLFPTGIIDWVIAIPGDQYENYRKVTDPCNLVAVPDIIPSRIGPTRHWIMENYRKKYKYIWMMDDDLTFLAREQHSLGLHNATTAEISAMFREARGQFKENIAAVGISDRLGNNRESAAYVDITRMNDTYIIDSEVYFAENITFAPYPDILAEDYHVTLCLLNAGYKNRVLFNFAKTDRGRNAPGGCSQYRNYDMQRKASMWMAEHHPEVSIKVKTSHNWKNFDSKGENAHRVDMLIQWKKAYKPKKSLQSNSFLDKLLKTGGK